MSLLIFVYMMIVLATQWMGCLPAYASEVKADLYAGWDSVLHKYVNSKGEVNYKAWKADRGDLDSFIQAAGNLTAHDCAGMNRDEQLALWINIYNAFTAKLVLDHYPIQRSGFNLYPSSSIRQIDGVWDKYRVTSCGRSVTLSEIENKILREEFREPLIHFAINCASRSCPKLLNRAYRSATLKSDLDEAAREFVNDSTRNQIGVKSGKVELSKIFDWFGDDFKERYGGQKASARSDSNFSAKDSAVINFLLAHTQGAGKELLASNKFTIGYLPYDWSLNEQGAKH